MKDLDAIVEKYLSHLSRELAGADRSMAENARIVLNLMIDMASARSASPFQVLDEYIDKRDKHRPLYVAKLSELGYVRDRGNSSV